MVFLSFFPPPPKYKIIKRKPQEVVTNKLHKPKEKIKKRRAVLQEAQVITCSYTTAGKEKRGIN